MKKLLLTLVTVAGLTVASQAQDFGFKKTDFIVEGSFQSSNKNDKNADVKTANFNFAPKAGYFVTNNIAVGVDLAFGQAKETTTVADVESIATARTFGAGVFGRYYFLEVGNRFKPYAELGAGYNNFRPESKVAGTTTKGNKTNGYGVNASIGANYFLTNSIAVNFAFANVVGFNSTKEDVDGAKAVNEFTTNVNMFDNFFNTAKFGLTFKF